MRTKWKKRQLLAVERRAEAIEEQTGKKVSIAAVCRRAEINQTSWTLWKYGKTTPRPGSWEKVERAITEIEREHGIRSAA